MLEHRRPPDLEIRQVGAGVDERRGDQAPLLGESGIEIGRREAGPIGKCGFRQTAEDRPIVMEDSGVRIAERSGFELRRGSWNAHERRGSTATLLVEIVRFCPAKARCDTVPIEFRDDADCRNAPKQDLKQHTTAARIEIRVDGTRDIGMPS